MDGTNPKVSFIPKSSLIREESFLERPRPRSVLGFMAITVFVLSIGSYAGLYYYNDTLNSTVAEKTTEIKKAQKEFSDAPEVGQAKVFRARADLARELLNSHTVASPVFSFLSKYTVDSILYDRFTFRNGSSGATLELSGEAPSYAALAYQADVLRIQGKELASFSFADIALTKFNTVTFSLTLVFNPDYLLYVKNLNAIDMGSTPAPAVQLPTENTSLSSPATISFSSTETTATKPSVTSSSSSAASTTTPTSMTTTVTPHASSTSNGNSVKPSQGAVTTSAPKVANNQSFFDLLWSKFKFW